ncbi:MAG: hypothetical protein NC113_03930 [Bacteroides sp.]|nr:hypothetical protein [Bacteroides sp.]MCM1447360.1 hypothetical protein [Bacteroides sp.]
MKQLCILFTFLILSMGTFAQGPDRNDRPARRNQFNEEAFRLRVQEFITQNAELSEQEAKAFFPIFHKYKTEQLAIHKRIHSLKQTPPKSDKEADYLEHVMQIAKLNNEAVQLDLVYYKKLCGIISAKKFYKVLNLEDQMHRNFLKNYNGKREKRGGATKQAPQPH